MRKAETVSTWWRQGVVRVAALGLLLYAAPFAAAQTGDVYVPAGSFEGSRSSADGQITVGGKWAGADDPFTLGWKITPQGDAYEYKYTVTAPCSPDLSHFILEVSENLGLRPPDFTDSSWQKYELKAFGSGPGNSNPGIPGSIYGVKFDDLPDAKAFTVTFLSNRKPVWGDFYTKGGQSYAYNSGFGQQPGGDFGGWIARPDTVCVPEPVTLAGLLPLLGPLGLLRRRSGKSG